jgi:predicted Ser/Thr protein kinase
MTYRFLRRLQSGGFSDVFAVEDPASALPERLVLKRLNTEMSARPEVREAFASEAKILRELRHPNVVTFRRCYFDDKGRVCLVMEEVAGEPLDSWARRHAAAPDAVLDVFEDVLQAVDYLHHRPHPFLHLDLKPDNILVTPTSGAVKPVLIDFGIARRSGRPGLKAFTPPYAAPEQESGGRLDEATDVHALGQVLAELLTGLHLPEEVMAALEQVAAQARNPARARRFPDAGQMGRGTASAARPALLTETVRVRWAWGLGAGVAAVLLLVAFALRGGDKAPGASDRHFSSGVAASGDAQRVDDLLVEARQAARNSQFDQADSSYVAAKRLADSLTQDEEAARALTLELEEVRQQIDLGRQGVWVGERSRLSHQEAP